MNDTTPMEIWKSYHMKQLDLVKKVVEGIAGKKQNKVKFLEDIKRIKKLHSKFDYPKGNIELKYNKTREEITKGIDAIVNSVKLACSIYETETKPQEFQNLRGNLSDKHKKESEIKKVVNPIKSGAPQELQDKINAIELPGQIAALKNEYTQYWPNRAETDACEKSPNRYCYNMILGEIKFRQQLKKSSPDMIQHLRNRESDLQDLFDHSQDHNWAATSISSQIGQNKFCVEFHDLCIFLVRFYFFFWASF